MNVFVPILLSTLPSYGLSFLFSKLFSANNLIGMGLNVSFSILIVLVFILLFGFKKSERDVVIMQIKKRFRYAK